MNFQGIVPVYLTKDESSHWYCIPLEMKELFNELHERACQGDHEAEDQFISTFSCYMTGGGPNNPQLYAKV